MTEVEMHIDTLKKLIPKINEYWDLLSYEKEAVQAALKALRAQQEREKGCDFCCYTEYPDKTLYPKDNYDFYSGYCTQTDADAFDEYEMEDVNFCTKCGRDMRGSINDN